MCVTVRAASPTGEVAHRAGGKAGGNDALADATSKAKKGFGAFMKGLNKFAEQTADQMAKAAEKMGIKDDEPGGAAQQQQGGAARH